MYVCDGGGGGVERGFTMLLKEEQRSLESDKKPCEIWLVEPSQVQRQRMVPSMWQSLFTAMEAGPWYQDQLLLSVVEANEQFTWISKLKPAWLLRPSYCQLLGPREEVQGPCLCLSAAAKQVVISSQAKERPQTFCSAWPQNLHKAPLPRVCTDQMAVRQWKGCGILGGIWIKFY